MVCPSWRLRAGAPGGQVGAEHLDLDAELAGQAIREGDKVVMYGAMTCGMAYEGLNNAGHTERDIIVVLNDNEMSISPNVGAMHKYLNKVVTNPLYNRVRDELNRLMVLDDPSPGLWFLVDTGLGGKHGLRNSLLIAIAPTATIASICGASECIEPQVSNLFKRETLSGDFVQINKYLVKELKAAGLWTEEIRNKIKLSEGSVQDIPEFDDQLKAIYRTAWEIPMRSLIDMAADRGAFIDQSQSLNLFMESPNIGKLSSMYMYAWQKGLKTTYYLRSRPATRIAQVSAAETQTASEPKVTYTDQEALVCSLENPEACEACQ